MSENAGVRIFHLYRKDGTSLFLHPFTERTSMVELFESGVPVGYYGEEPPIERFTELRSQLQRIADNDARHWILDQRFATRFVVSGMVFLGVYFFSTFLIRIPIPVIDDILIAIAVAVVSYVLLARRDGAGRDAMRKRAELRACLDSARFDFSESLYAVEQLLREYEAATPEEVLHRLRRTATDSGAGEPSRVPKTDSQLIHDLVVDIERYLKQNGAFSNIKVVRRWLRRPAADHLAQACRRFNDSEHDLPLLALFLELKYALSHDMSVSAPRESSPSSN